MAFRWQAENGPSWNAGLVALLFSKGSGPVLLKILYFCDFPGDGPDPLPPPPPPPPPESALAVLNINSSRLLVIHYVNNKCTYQLVHIHSITQVNRMYRSRRVLAIGGKYCDYGWTGSVFIHFHFLQKVSWRRKQQTGCFYIE